MSGRPHVMVPRTLIAVFVMVAAPAAAARELVSIEKCEGATRPPGDCRLVPLQLIEPETQQLRELIAKVERRQEQEQREAERDGKVTGGVWGFVNYGYRVAFTSNKTTEYAWLHVADGAAWVDFVEPGHVVFDRTESRTVRAILSRLEAAAESTEHRPLPPAEIVQRLPIAVTWKLAKEIDLNCDLIPDHVFTASDETHYFVAAVAAPSGERSIASVVALERTGDSQAALCGEPGELAEEELEENIVEVLGEEPKGWRHSTSCKGLRLGSGDCDRFHIYWNAAEQRIAWWRL